MDKEVIRGLCQWMADRHELELDRIRVGHKQSSRAGSATMYYDEYGELVKLSLSVSDYPTATRSDYWNNRNKVKILDTIIHEFAHFVLCEHRHTDLWYATYYQLIVKDWKELVKIYNLLSTDCVPDDWMFLYKNIDTKYFDRYELEKVLSG